MYPTRRQVRELKRAFAVARIIYNKTVDTLKRTQTFNLIKIRNEILAQPQPHFADGNLRVARTIQEGAVKQAFNAFRTNEAKKRLNHSHTYNIRFRSLKHTPTEVITFQKDGTPDKKKTSTLLRFTTCVSERVGKSECNAYFGNNLKDTGGIRMQDSEKVIKRLVAEGNRLREDGKIMWDKRTKAFYFIYAYVEPLLNDPDPNFENKRIVATDPGINPFHAWYSPTSGEYGELLNGARDTLETVAQKLMRLSLASKRECSRKEDPDGIDIEYTRTSKQRYQTTRRLKKKLARDRVRMHNWMERAHYDSANFLLGRFDIIIEPALCVSEMVRRESRNLSSKSARRMLTWSHYKFRERLRSACSRYPGRYVIESREPGTSKTCTNCGFFNKALTLGEKTYVCPSCSVSVDRDVAGARNNFFSEYGRAVGVGWDGASD
jgi:transposase